MATVERQIYLVQGRYMPLFSFADNVIRFLSWILIIWSLWGSLSVNPSEVLFLGWNELEDYTNWYWQLSHSLFFYTLCKSIPSRCFCMCMHTHGCVKFLDDIFVKLNATVCIIWYIIFLSTLFFWMTMNCRSNLWL